MAKFKPGQNKFSQKSLISKLQVLLGSDDGEEDYGTTWLANGFSGNQITTGHDGTGSCTAAFRFLRPNIPNNGKISKAILRVKCSANSTKRPNLKIKGILEVATNTFGSAARPSARTKTTAAVDWDPSVNWAIGTWYESPDITAIINEIISQPEYAGKSIGIVIENDSSPSNNYEMICDSNGGTANAAQLTLTIEPNLL